MYKQLTPVLIVDAIEPVLPFWESLGFERTAEVPHGDRLGFVIFSAGGVEVMYQTRASIADDLPAVLEAPAPGAADLFVTVDDLDAVAVRIPKSAPVLVARRTTFYGADETIVRDPAGNVVCFAQMAK
jgi:uncharacterized glyoxalase superfamily protein PhnB